MEGRKMAEIRLDVPLVKQRQRMSCWYAAACMVSYYYRVGPRLGIPKVWTNNKGISPAQLHELASVEGLLFLNSADHEFTSASLIATLSKHGPIWSAGRWEGFPHGIVISGADDVGQGTVHYNDPGNGFRKSGSIAWFNEKRMRGTMMIKDKNRY